MSYKGSSWKKHKYVRKFNNRYYYSLDAYIRSHKNELKNELSEKVPQLDRSIEKRKKFLDQGIRNTPKKDLNIRIPKLNLNEIKMTPEIRASGKETFNRVVKTAKNINDTIAGKIIQGVKYFNKILAKIF